MEMQECTAHGWAQRGQVCAIGSCRASGQQREESQMRQLLVRFSKGKPAAPPRPSTHHHSCVSSVPGLRDMKFNH